jgi:hypothetical protein
MFGAAMREGKSCGERWCLMKVLRVVPHYGLRYGFASATGANVRVSRELSGGGCRGAFAGLCRPGTEVSNP